MDERWRNIWNLEVPNVTKLFLWKAGNNLLPTKENLFKRKVVEDKRCPVCSAETETIMHALWVYPATNDIWAEVRGCVQKWGRIEEEFLLLWGKLMGRLSMKKLEDMIALKGLLEFKAAQILTKQVVKGQNSNSRSAMRWEKPESGCVNVNWDASLNLKERRMGAGIIVRDEKGKAIVVVCDQKANVDNPMVAECFALRMVVELCSELNIHKVVFEGDARIIIEAVQSFEEESSLKLSRLVDPNQLVDLYW
ncbi:uncharacterized protein LOC121252140 [Juglans microcarpa x Juglans regia]|uniref:uncharacterized protein LOC121252140 n=1 Tax=Juglans microcarpa x Juglans regia TaxID=2249226 RepID=UPI001B7E5AB4|nr:uncharacterized protein LOC121252140 [Juglans microcarpa x Juglans regia]